MERQRTQCRKLSREFYPAKLTVKLVLDDESFFTLKNDELDGNRGFYTDNKENTPPGVKYKFKAKYEKLLVWLAISENGHSAPYFCPSGCSINGDIYRNECISARLVPMIDELHGDGDYLFWPDLAPAHYAHATIVLFQENNIKFVPKDANPPNVPQLRPIEDIWLWVKREVYANGWEAANLEQLKRRVKKCLRKMNWEPIRKAILQIKSKLRKAADNGALSSSLMSMRLRL